MLSSVRRIISRWRLVSTPTSRPTLPEVCKRLWDRLYQQTQPPYVPSTNSSFNLCAPGQGTAWRDDVGVTTSSNRRLPTPYPIYQGNPLIANNINRAAQYTPTGEGRLSLAHNSQVCNYSGTPIPHQVSTPQVMTVPQYNDIVGSPFFIQHKVTSLPSGKIQAAHVPMTTSERYGYVGLSKLICG